eukprot:m.196245 g.196245  ORF g.196245 m.196245 type:complete len:243 (+) comp53741_c0_seq8:16-744(+)
MFTEANVRHLCAAVSNHRMPVCQLMVREHGSGIITAAPRHEHKNTALHLAALNNCPDILESFIQLKIDINVLNAWGWTPLMWAANNGQMVCARILLNAGASTIITDQWGKTALDLARAQNRRDVALLLEEHERLLTAQQSIKPAAREQQADDASALPLQTEEVDAAHLGHLLAISREPLAVNGEKREDIAERAQAEDTQSSREHETEAEPVQQLELKPQYDLPTQAPGMSLHLTDGDLKLDD